MLKLFRPILFVCGLLLLIFSLLLLAVAAFAALTQDQEAPAFLLSALSTGGVGTFMVLGFRTAKFTLTSRQLYLLTSCSWLLMALAGALPFSLSHYHFPLTDAVFESASGITTTGSTVLAGLDQMPQSLLLWRSVLQWLGGLGVIGMAVSILPFLRIGGMRLFQSESSDWSDKTMPRLQGFARLLLVSYLAASCACALCYWLAGMTGFDAINHAMTTISTGGYATSDQSFARFDTPILWLAVIFMLIGALPFTLFIRFFLLRGRTALMDIQAAGLLAAVAILTLVLSSYLLLTERLDPFAALTHAAFNLTSVITTTGYASTNYSLWGNFSLGLFFLLTFVGGCSGSTSGGMKIFRFQLSYLFLRDQLRKLVHPQGVFAIKYNGKPVQDDIMISAVAFSFMFFVAFALVTLSLALLGSDLITSISAAATALANVGPGLGEVIGPAGNFAPLSDAAKWILSFAMILGRLELLTLMVLFTPTFWRG